MPARSAHTPACPPGDGSGRMEDPEAHGGMVLGGDRHLGGMTWPERYGQHCSASNPHTWTFGAIQGRKGDILHPPATMRRMVAGGTERDGLLTPMRRSRPSGAGCFWFFGTR